MPVSISVFYSFFSFRSISNRRFFSCFPEILTFFITFSDAPVESGSRLKINNDLSSLTIELANLKPSCDLSSTNKTSPKSNTNSVEITHNATTEAALKTENTKLKKILDTINIKLAQLKTQFEEQDRVIRSFKNKEKRVRHFDRESDAMAGFVNFGMSGSEFKVWNFWFGISCLEFQVLNFRFELSI